MTSCLAVTDLAVQKYHKAANKLHDITHHSACYHKRCDSIRSLSVHIVTTLHQQLDNIVHACSQFATQHQEQSSRLRIISHHSTLLPS